MSTRSDIIGLLKELFTVVEPIPDEDPDRHAGAYRSVGWGGEDSLFFRGRALELLRRIEWEQAEHWGSGGWTPDSITRMVDEACRVARERGEEAGVQAFVRMQTSPPRVWTIYLEARDHFYYWEAAEGVAIAGATFNREPPPELADDDFILRMLKGPQWRVQVAARDDKSALFLAHDRVEQARAILALGDPGVRRSFPAAVLVNDQGLPGSQSGGAPRLMSHAVNSDGRLWPGLQQLSDAAASPEPQRTDWQRRVLDAARWRLKAATTTWYPESLAASMTALECLLLRGRQEPQKGKLIARRATRIAVLRHIEADQPEWLEQLYKRRNDVVHEGLSVAEDLEVEALGHLVYRICQFAVDHLDPDHRDDGVACETFLDVLSCAHLDDE